MMPLFLLSAACTAAVGLGAVTVDIPQWEISIPACVGSAAAYNGMLFFGAYEDDNTFYALDQIDGRQVWNFTGNDPMGRIKPVFGSNGYVYAGSDDEEVYALVAATGEMVWTKDLCRYQPNGFAIDTATDTLYVACTYEVFAVNGSTGAILWSLETSSYNFDGPPVLGSNGILYAPFNGSYSAGLSEYL